MKKFIAVSLSAAMLLALAACGNNNTSGTTASIIPATTPSTEATEATTAAETEETTEAEVDDSYALEKSEGVMTYAEYAAAEVDDEVVIEGFVQAKHSWWDDKVTLYLQDPDGAYFCYDMACAEEDYDLLVIGQKIKVTGFKAEWSGEIEIADATFEIEDGNWIAEPTDVTDLLASDDLIDLQNQFVSFSDLEIAATIDNEGNECAFLYNWDGSGSQGDDIYFTVTDGENTYVFTVESYLTDSSTDVYQAVEGLEIGDTVDMEGFLYWYEGVQPHITSVTVK
ncbi:MAG: hypothetical protein MJ103_07715 [Saccharofermentans sp.]|nr:hypothetical protein [Saccharofermentans sp.]